MKFKKNLLIFLSIHLFLFSIITQYAVARAERSFEDPANPYNLSKYENIENVPYNTEITIKNLSTEEKIVTGNTKHYITWDNDNIDTSKYKVEIYAQPYIKYIPATDEDVAKVVENIDNIPWKEVKMPIIKCCSTDAADCGTVINFSDIYQTYIDNLDYSEALEQWETEGTIANAMDVIGRFLHIGTPAEDIANKYSRLYFYLTDDKYAQYIKFSRVKYYARYISNETTKQIVYDPIYEGKQLNPTYFYVRDDYKVSTKISIIKYTYNGPGQFGMYWKLYKDKDEKETISLKIGKIVNGQIKQITTEDSGEISFLTITDYKMGNSKWSETETVTINIPEYVNQMDTTGKINEIDVIAIHDLTRIMITEANENNGTWNKQTIINNNDSMPNILNIPYTSCYGNKLPEYSQLVENDATITRPSGGNGDFVGPTQKPAPKPAPDDEEDSKKDKEATSKHKTDEDGTKNTKDILYYVKKIYKLLKAWFIFDAIDKIWNELKEIVKDEIDEKVNVATQTADIAASRFPFCVVAIPITVLNAIATDPVTPGADKTTIPIKFEKTKIGNIEFKGYEYKLKLDFKPFNNIAKVTRACIYLLFLMYLGTRTMRVYNAFIKE